MNHLKKPLNLSNRLSAIASFVPEGGEIADIGTDHGYIPVWLIQNGRTDHVTATDIKEGPLNAAALTAKTWGITKIHFMRTDGLNGLDAKDYDTIILAGMGGETIINILTRACWKWEERHRLILQPMSKIPELCRYLYENGWMIDNEKLAMDEGVLYRIILARPGIQEVPAPEFLYAGLALFEKNDPLLPGYLNMLIRKTKRAIDGLEKGKTDHCEVLTSLKEVLFGFYKMREMISLGET